jgi:HSP20 family molecular chaperone IbpA
MVKFNAEPTNIVRWNPIEELTDMRRRMDDLFNRDFAYTPLSRLFPTPTELYTFEPIVDCVPTDTTLEVFVLLPGFTPEAIHVEVQPTNLIINGERPPLSAIKPVRYVPNWATVEATFAINYTLPIEVVPTEVKATLQNGILHLVLPIAEKARLHSVPVKVLPI